MQRLKDAVNAAETAHEDAVAQRADALRAHDALTQGRSTKQAALAVLLQRRDAWDADDVQKFTRATADEHALKDNIGASLAARETSERAAETAERAFLKAVRSQYHGELMWQEKYRALSLYSTWALIIVNSLFFVGSGVHRNYADRDRLKAVERAAAELRVASEAAAAAATRAAAVAADAADRAAAALTAARAPPPVPPRRWSAVRARAAAALQRAAVSVGTWGRARRTADPRAPESRWRTEVAPAACSVVLGIAMAWRWR